MSVANRFRRASTEQEFFSFDPFRSRIDHCRVDLFRDPEPQRGLGLAPSLRKSWCTSMSDNRVGTH